jgi:hypothetical protein
MTFEWITFDMTVDGNEWIVSFEDAFDTHEVDDRD